MIADSDTDYVTNRLRVLVPKPSPYQLIRLGGSTDGAYLVPDDLEGIGACFSPGVNRRKLFEDELAERYGVRAHLCDGSCDVNEFQTPLLPEMQTFEKLWLYPTGDPGSIDLETWVMRHSPDQYVDLLLQMDIEGAEYSNLLPAPEHLMNRFRVVVIELHRLGVAKDPTAFRNELGPLLEKLDRTHVCLHVHPNNASGVFMLPGTDWSIPHTLEATFIRRDRLAARSADPLIPPSLPHPMDIPWNTDRKPPIFLGPGWHLHGITEDAKAKRLQDLRAYFQLRLKRLSVGVNGIRFHERDCFEEVQVLSQSIESLERFVRDLGEHATSTDATGSDATG